MTPYFQIIVRDNMPKLWGAIVNVSSDSGSNDQAFVVDPLENQPILAKLSAVAVGYTALPNHVPGLALDFVREPPFDPTDVQVLPLIDPAELRRDPPLRQPKRCA